MWTALQATFQQDKSLPARAARIQALQRVLAGTQYDELKYGFHDETNGAGEYVKLRERRPSVRYNLCKMVVTQSVAMLFSEGHFPQIECDDEPTRDALREVARGILLNETMIEAAHRGSVGSVCIWLRILKGRLFPVALPTQFLTPVWKPDCPDELVLVRERYRVRGADLAAAGYTIKKDDLRAWYWFTRDWGTDEETWYVPVKAADDDAAAPKLTRDSAKSVAHMLGFVPMVWIKNLPGGDETDGCPTFDDEAIETNIEIEYLLSQGGRGLKYSADPLLLIKEPASDPGQQMVRSASNAIIVSEKGDAKLVEIDGAASGAVLEYAKALRDMTIEQLSGNRVNPDKLHAAQSGRAMELLNQTLIWLTDKLRITYGERGLKRLLGMIVAAQQKVMLTDADGERIARMNPAARLSLKWPDWYPPTADDRSTESTTLRTLTDAGLMSRETAVGVVAPAYDVEDIPAELTRIAIETARREANAQKQIKIVE